VHGHIIEALGLVLPLTTLGAGHILPGLKIVVGISAIVFVGRDRRAYVLQEMLRRPTLNWRSLRSFEMIFSVIRQQPRSSTWSEITF
jgi:hypothetical protein